MTNPITPLLKITRAQAIKEEWYRGNLTYMLHKGQREVKKQFESVVRQLFVANISRQWGKSFWAVTEAIGLALRKPKARIKYATAFQTDLVEFIMPTFEIVLLDCPANIRPRFKVQGSKWIFKNGSEIKLVGLDKQPNSLRGNTIDLIIIDEAGFVSNLDYIYTSVIIPATTHRPDCKIIMVSTPPSTPAHAFTDFIQKAELEGSYVKADIYTNPRINQGTIQRLMDESGGPDSTTWRREYLCAIVTDANSAIIAEWKTSYIEDRQRDVYWPFYHKYVAMDLGVKDQTAAIFGYYDFLRAQLVIEEEFVMSGVQMTTERLKAKIQATELAVFGEQYKPYLRISDNNNPLLIQDLSHLHGLHFLPTDKGTLEEMINALKMMVHRGQIIVKPNCKQLAGCLQYGVWDKRRIKFAQSKTYGHFDALAALVYLVRNLNKHTNPIPQTFQVDQTNSVVFYKQNDNEAASVLKKAFIGGK